MDANGIVSYSRRLYNVSAGQIDDPKMLIILNKAYKDIYKKIVNLDRNYFWDRWTDSTIANQYEYRLLSPTADEFGIFKPEKLRIKYLSTDDYVDVNFKDWDNLTETPEYYAVNQPTDEPFTIITDNKFIHIFPTPTVAVTGGLLIEGAKLPYDLTISSTEEDILIDPLYHETLAYMMGPTVYKETGQLDKKNDALQEAELEIRKALTSMGVLTTKAIRCKRPDLSSLE